MLEQNIRLFFRVISRERLHTLLTVGGLALGLAAVLLAFVFIQDENSFDGFHAKKERIFRVNKWVKETSGEQNEDAETPGLMAASMEEDLPEVEAAARIAPWFDKVLVSYEDQHLQIENWVFADSNFFYLFDFKVIAGGDPHKLLLMPGQMVLTQTLAKRLFGDRDPIGKSIKGLNDRLYTVSGIVEDAPRQSHIQFDALVSWASTQPGSNFLSFSFMNNWLGQTVYTYVLLRDPGQMATVNDKMANFTAQHMPDRIDRYRFFLQPLKEVYLHSYELRYLRFDKMGSASFLRTFSIIALLILLIACFNYINMTTARSLQRIKEVGVKKVLGAQKGQLLKQFLIETAGMVIFSTFLATSLAPLLLPRLNAMFGKEIPVESVFSTSATGFLLAIILLTSVLAGLFPGLMLSQFKPISIFQQRTRLSSGGELPRQILTTLQLTVSVALIIGTILLQKQFSYLLNRDLGFDKEQVMVMHTPPGIDSSATAFREALSTIPGVISLSICQATASDGTFGSGVFPDKASQEELPVQLFRVDTAYLRTYGMEMAAGRFLDRSSDIDPGAVVINETLAHQMDWDNPLEKSIRFNATDEPVRIVGVIKDFNFSSLHEAVSPLVMYLDGRKSNVSLRFDPAQLANLLPQVQQIWERFEARFPFDYYFVDEYFSKQYTAEQQMLNVIRLFSILAIFIACLGLYGLTSFAIARRRKEIGIRKVLGASIRSIMALLSSSLLKLTGIALLLATPLVWYLSTDWLQNFAYHVNLSWWMFLAAGLLMVVIVMATVGIQSMRAAVANPVKALRME
ncbi:MAG: ABC transporter permease [Saprospiraceae bacterium]